MIAPSTGRTATDARPLPTAPQERARAAHDDDALDRRLASAVGLLLVAGLGLLAKLLLHSL